MNYQIFMNFIIFKRCENGLILGTYKQLPGKREHLIFLNSIKRFQ